ncbi:MAG: hypothetical protein DWQ06_08905 [Calditrichaeota bacterium]|nr:MAG: hypothetical protein DWQ06_08905 [Calditrichota bacterium]
MDLRKLEVFQSSILAIAVLIFIVTMYFAFFDINNTTSKILAKRIDQGEVENKELQGVIQGIEKSLNARNDFNKNVNGDPLTIHKNVVESLRIKKSANTEELGNRFDFLRLSAIIATDDGSRKALIKFDAKNWAVSNPGDKISRDCKLVSLKDDHVVVQTPEGRITRYVEGASEEELKLAKIRNY